jgi:DNA polymerase elongation subunit (family B)
MYSNEYFVLKRQLDQETKRKIERNLPSIHDDDGDDNRNGDDNDRLKKILYVVEWMEDDKDQVIGYGCDVNGNAARIRIDAELGLYAVTNDLPTLRSICSFLSYNVIAYPQFKYKSNNFAPYDLLFDYDVTKRDTFLVKIVTPTVRESMELFYRFRKDERSYKYVSVPLYWSVTNFIIFERMIKYYKNNGDKVDYTVPRVTMRWFDDRLNCYHYPEPDIPIITFDIETVSNDPNRVPTGEHQFDELFTVSIHHNHTKMLYTLIYLPLSREHEIMNGGNRAIETIINDGYPMDSYSMDETNNVTTNVLEIFDSEKALLIRTMDLLQADPKGEKLHYLVGYNSFSYDIKYLFIRSAYYKLPCFENFVYREGYAYGVSQIHLDLFRIIMMQYRLKRYTLNNVAKQLMQDTKTGVNAVQLRYTFHAIRKHQKYFTHEECEERWPSVRDILHYNNYDTILVSKLLKKVKSIEFTLKQAHECRIPLSKLNTNYNKMRFKLWSKCFVVGLEIGIFLGTFKSSIARIKYPVDNNMTDFLEFKMNLEDQLLTGTGRFDDDKQYTSSLTSKKYPGGANFCLGEYMADDVHILDYRIAYPLLIDRQNISDETATILPARVLLETYRLLGGEERAREFRTFDYLTHTGTTKSETTILYHQYIYNGLYCGGEFPFVESELARRHNAPVVLIWNGRRGVLSDIISKFNINREETKNIRKMLTVVTSTVEEKINEVMEEKQQMASMMSISIATAAAAAADAAANNDNTNHDKEDGDDDDEDGDFGGLNDNDNDNDDDDDEDGDFGGLNDDNDDDNNDNFVGINDHCNDKDDDDDDGNFGGINDHDNDCNDEDNDDGNFGGINEEDREEDDGNFGGTNNNDDESDGNFGITNIEEDDDDEFRPPPNKIIHLEEKNNNNDDHKKIITTKSNNIFDFSFENKYIKFYPDKTFDIDDEALSKLSYDDRISELERIRADANIELALYRSSYELQKSLVASIYGCIGSSSPVCAALITNGIRSTILQAAQYVASLNYTVYYIDTDSLFIRHPTDKQNVSPILNKMFPHTEIEMKVCKRCMFVQKKTYYKIDDDNVLKYFQHVNGPAPWYNFVQFVYNRVDLTTNQDIYQMFVDFFNIVYDELMQHESVTPELLSLFVQDVKIKSHYRTNTYLSKLKEYLTKNYPTLASNYAQTVYYEMDTDVKNIKFVPSIHMKSIDQIHTINMFKFYQNMFKTVFNIIKFNIKRNNEPFTVTISAKPVLLMMISAYLDVHKYRFPHVYINSEDVNTVSLNVDGYYNEKNDDGDFFETVPV